MSAHRLYSPAVVRAVRAAVKRGTPIRVVAKRHGMSPSTVSNMSRRLIYRDARDVKREKAARARAAAEREAVNHTIAPETPPVGAVEAAILERARPGALVVESLEQRLERLLPGTICQSSPSPRCSPLERWRVYRGPSILARGPTPREAVDKAVMLFGSAR